MGKARDNSQTSAMDSSNLKTMWPNSKKGDEFTGRRSNTRAETGRFLLQSSNEIRHHYNTAYWVLILTYLARRKIPRYPEHKKQLPGEKNDHNVLGDHLPVYFIFDGL